MTPREELLQMLSYRRPRDSKAERKFIHRWLKPLGAKADKHGNYVLRVGDNPTVLWSSHTDTVHSADGRQALDLIPKDGIDWIMASDPKVSSCLGADNTVGVWLMVNMIRANVPGVYVFHYGEESGCLGSRGKAAGPREFFDGLTSAIAFDRRRTTSIITHQSSTRTCSDAFAQSLAAAMPIPGHEWKLDDGGIFTDTNSYRSIIPECTNVSAGFISEHTQDEALNLTHALALRDVMVAFDASKLVISRDPAKVETKTYNYGGYTSYKGWAPKGKENFYEKRRRERLIKLGYLVGEGDDEPGLDDYLSIQYGVGAPATDNDASVGHSSSASSSADKGDDIALIDALDAHPVAAAYVMASYGIGAEEIYDAAYRGMDHEKAWVGKEHAA